MNAPRPSFAFAPPASGRAQFVNPLFVRCSKALPEFLTASPQQYEGVRVSKSSGCGARTFSTRIKLSNVQLRTEISAVLLQFPAKEIAKAAGSSVGTAQNAREGHHTMSLPHFINLCRDIPELRALALRLMGCGGETDPQFVRGLHDLINSYVRRGE